MKSHYVKEKTLHGMTNSPTYISWAMMKQRCYNTKDRCYSSYGGRGISVCDRWIDKFENFLNDMGVRPSDMTLDRLDVDGDYFPDNCVWSGLSDQSRNRRNTVKLTYKGRTMHLMDWAVETGININTLRYRVYNGWEDNKVIEHPVGKNYTGG